MYPVHRVVWGGLVLLAGITLLGELGCSGRAPVKEEVAEAQGQFKAKALSNAPSDADLANDEVPSAEPSTNYNVERLEKRRAAGEAGRQQLQPRRDGTPAPVPSLDRFGQGGGRGEEEEANGRRAAPGGVGGRSGSAQERMLREGAGAVKKDKSDAKPGEKAPQVWKRDRQRPTFARVYVGDGNALELVSLNVTTTIEGPRARTVVDHIFRNPHDRRLEGTFEYPLPSGASPSYFAMFLGQTRDTIPPRFARRGEQPALPADALALLTPAQLVKHVDTADWGTLQEARIVSREKALETYEEIVRGRIDPALLEYAGGNTFSGRVFPIPPKGYNRVLIAYEELLPITQAGVQYRFPLPDCKLNELQYTLNASAEECKTPTFKPDDVPEKGSGTLKPKVPDPFSGTKKDEAGSRLSYHRTWADKGPGGDIVFAFNPPRPQLQVISGRQDESGPLHLYARIRPELKIKADKPFAEHAVFLLDTSLSEHADRFAVNLKLMKKILEGDSSIRQFNILAFNVGSTWVEPKGWLENTPAGREQALARLDGIVLEGATDLSAALDRLAKPDFAVAPGTPLNVFLLSDGQITWGESQVNRLTARFDEGCPFLCRFHCYRTGIGADNLELFEALTRKGGGIFNCFTDADLASAAAAHRHQCFQVERVRFVGGPEASEVLIAGRKAAVYPGGELIVAARMKGTGRTQLVVEGTFLGQKHAEEYPVEVTAAGELAPRGWGEIAVASLLALNDPKLNNVVTAYCQQYGVGSRVASFLVLENVADYKRLNLEEERGKTVRGGDLSVFLEESWRSLGRAQSAREAYQQFLDKIEPRVRLLGGPDGAHVKSLLALLTDKDFDLPEGTIAGALLRTADVPPEYLRARNADRRHVTTYIAEARRRAAAQDLDGAVRVLSSVVEEYPARADALRLVGYRLLDLKQPGHASRLFQQVQRNRPFEPHSYRDLARSLEESGKFGLAAVQYEIVLAGTWHNRFRESLKLVVHEEYARMMRQAIQQRAVGSELANHFGERLERMRGAITPSDLRVTISWNTDATDVDLWVIEPDGTKCFYQHARTKNGGELSQDQTQGYGPERYQVKKAQPGIYTVIVHYYSANPNLLAGETHVNVAVTRNADSSQEVVERYNVILQRKDQQIEVCKVKF